MTAEYNDLLAKKIKTTERVGIKVLPNELHPSTLPHQERAIILSLEIGRSLIALNCGRGKSHVMIEISRILQSRFGGKCLIVTELGVSQEFVDPVIGEGARLGVDLVFVKSQIEVDAHYANDTRIFVTNYETVRLGKIDFAQFLCVCLDEGSYIKTMASDTTDALHREMEKVQYKYVATATPSPNEVLELINYAHILRVCDRGQILTRFFQRNSQVAGDLTLHPHHEEDFWLWVLSWSIWDDIEEGEGLPPLNIHWHLVDDDNMDTVIKADRDGQFRLVFDASGSLPEAAALKKATINERVSAAMDIVLANPEESYILWHHLEDERKAIKASFDYYYDSHDIKATYGDIYGSQDWTVREQRIIDFSTGKLQILGTKPEISAVGCNFQKHGSDMIFIGINHSFEMWYQAFCRRWRFGQTKPVNVHMIYVRGEEGIRRSLEGKWKLHRETRIKMREMILKYGLDQTAYYEEKKRSFITDRVEWIGKEYQLVNNDCVLEAASMVDRGVKVQMILSSFPFGNHYEYSDKYNDMGHNETDDDFLNQLDFLIPSLHEMLEPGRVAAIHLKNRIHYGSVTGLGFSTFHRFTHMVCDRMEKHGFHTIGFHYVPTDVVRENNQTYRLGYSEMQKDSTKMGAGIPEEIWIFRKAPTSRSDAYADSPVQHNHIRCIHCGHEDLPKEFVVKKSATLKCKGCKQVLVEGELWGTQNMGYSLANWQLDADAFWKTSGDRYLTPEELQAFGIDKLQAWWEKYSIETIYDFEQHLELLNTLQKRGKLSSTFTTLPMRTDSPYIMQDVNAMKCLNAEQSRRKLQNHICPQPFDEVDRLIELYSNEGDTIYEPFAGIGTTGVRAIKKRRKAILTELNSTYAQTAAIYLNEAEKTVRIPSIMDLLQV